MTFPPASFVAVEGVAFVAAFGVLLSAWRESVARVAVLVAGMLFGLVIEIFFVTQYAGYAYGNFLVDLPVKDGIPLWVAAGWGTIIAVSMKASDRTGLVWYTRPALDGLLAVSLDLAIDPVAEALGWWHWIRPAQYFGVPCDNFIGWMLIVSGFGFFTRLGYQIVRPGRYVWWDLLVPLVALVPAVGFVAGVQWVLEHYGYPVLGEPGVYLLLGSVLVLVVGVAAKTAQPPGPLSWEFFWVPAVYHGLMLILGVTAGVHPEFFVLLPLAGVASLLAFRFPGELR